MKLKKNNLMTFLLLILVFWGITICGHKKKINIEGAEIFNVVKYYEEQIKNMLYIKTITLESVETQWNIVENDKASRSNILKSMENGMENMIITEFYSQEIEEVKTIFDNKSIKILYHSVDLNEDGLDDMIVYLISSYHSGASGDSFRILINEGNEYRQLQTAYILRLCNFEENTLETGYVYVLDTKTNGYHDIEIRTLDNIIFLLKFDGEGYQQIRKSS